MAGWTLDLDKWAEKQKSDMLDVKRTFALMLFTKVVQRTPVDSGAHRQNWLVTINQESFEYNPGLQKGGRVLSTGKGQIDKARAGDKIILQNNGPAITKLEYGGYPKPPMRGTKVSKKGVRPAVYEIKTVGGFSKQAPRGMVGVTMAESGATLTEAVNEVKR